MSVHYHVRFRPSAEKELAKLDPPVRARVLRHITALIGDPRPPGVTRLVGADTYGVSVSATTGWFTKFTTMS